MCVAGSKLLPGLCTREDAWGRAGEQKRRATTTRTGSGDLLPGSTWSIFHETGDFSESLRTIQRLCQTLAKFS